MVLYQLVSFTISPEREGMQYQVVGSNETRDKNCSRELSEVFPASNDQEAEALGGIQVVDPPVPGGANRYHPLWNFWGDYGVVGLG